MKDYPFDLGDVCWSVSTESDDAQVWFNRGLAWIYGFNHEEAVYCFQKAAEHDPNCAMAHWGVSYAAGPNYNKPWEVFDDYDREKSLGLAFEESRCAMDLVKTASSAEVALIEAIQCRYQSPVPVPDMENWNDSFANSMRIVNSTFPGDDFIESLFVEAMMTRTPWNLWNRRTGQVAEGADTLEAKQVLESSMNRLERHGRCNPGLLHLYIHLMETSPNPELALNAADALRNAVPDAGHLKHMPSHIDAICGDYASTVSANSAAIEVDMKYLDCYGPLNYYSFYRCHNFHFKIYGAMFLGQYGTAIKAADQLISSLPEELLRMESPPMADWLESFVSVRQHIWVRFGRWEEILGQELPSDQELYCATTATMRYARTVAHAVKGELKLARREAIKFDRAHAAVPESRTLFGNTYRDLLSVARETMLGELAYREGEFDLAFTRLRNAVNISEELPYEQSWAWMQPVRHALGALLLEQGRIQEALGVYAEDLGFDASVGRSYQRPNNVWSLSGYLECLDRLGLEDQQAAIRQRLQIALARSDSAIKYSCFCRQASQS